jgi:4-hydroxybenzoate polyprenyltransferase
VPRAAGHLAGLVRLAHPFPSSLNALATATIAALAGAGWPTVTRLAAAMLLLQASIGALNDLADAGLDSGRKPGKPLPRGAVTMEEAAALTVVAAVAGLGLSALSGPATGLVALAGLGCGYAYDLRLSRTAWSWLPLAVGLPLLPVYAWIGAGQSLPAGLLALLPIGVVAGASLGIGNGLVDAERDALAGRRTAVVLLGRSRAWPGHAAGLAIVGLSVGLWAPRAGEPLGTVGLVAGGGLLAAGAALTRTRRAALRERGWELEALGTALLGATWLAGVAIG